MAQPGGVLSRAGTHRSRLRPRAHLRARAGGRHRRDPERRRHHGAPAATRGVREAARPEARHDRRPDPLSPREGALGRAHRRAGDRDGLRAVPPVLLRRPREQHRAPRARPRVARAHVHSAGPRAPEGYGARSRRRPRAGPQLVAAQRARAHRARRRRRRRAAAPARESARDRRGRPHGRSGAARTRARPARRCCAPTASAHRSCATSASRGCAC